MIAMKAVSLIEGVAGRRDFQQILGGMFYAHVRRSIIALRRFRDVRGKRRGDRRSVAKIKKEELSEKKLPIMAVAGAFVFAAQKINFTIPATGSSGHIGGGILLAALLGGAPALLTISAVLVIQCLFFADGGLLALGSNIFNMGVIPCLVIYPLLFKPLMKKGTASGRLTLASVVSVVVALQLGAFSVVLETLASGITALPFSSFVLLMQPIHLAIGIVEGLVTGAVLSFVWKTRPEILESAESGDDTRRRPAEKVLAMLAALTLVTGAILSGFASDPDGLEWSVMADGSVLRASAAL
ncbi:MAG: energy-coupling factor ABC transporter permease [Cloacibacillus evryensis]